MTDLDLMFVANLTELDFRPYIDFGWQFPLS